MMQTKWTAVLLGCSLTLAGCIEFRNDVDTDRDIRIIEVSPLADATTGLRQKFSAMIDDSFNRPGELRVYASIDGAAKRKCEYDRNPTNTIDESRQENIFRCKFDTAKLAPGPHIVKYWVVDRDDEDRAKLSRKFTHDNAGPKLELATDTFDGSLRLTWKSDDKEDFTEIGAYVNGVRIFSSGEAQGEVVLEPGSYGENREIELRAYDLVKNTTTETIAIP